MRKEVLFNYYICLIYIISMPAPTKYHSIDSLITYKYLDYITNEKMNPNAITLFNIIPSLISLYYVYHKDYLLFFIFLIIRTVLDCLDGLVARKYNKTSKLGAFLDIFTDLCFNSALLYIVLNNYSNDVKLYSICLFLIISLYWYYYPNDLTNIIPDNSLLSSPLIYAIIIYINNHQKLN